MNTTETDLIFETYAKSRPLINEGYESSEGAVNLLEQLKAEVPELEDKINQVLEKVFDAVDILKQESYADDPQLQKVYASLIQGDF